MFQISFQKITDNHAFLYSDLLFYAINIIKIESLINTCFCLITLGQRIECLQNCKALARTEASYGSNKSQYDYKKSILLHYFSSSL